MKKTNLDNLEYYAWDFLKENVEGKIQKWKMPFNIIEELPLVGKGNFGKFLIGKLCNSAGLNTIPSSQNVKVYDWEINGHRVAVKFAFESQDLTWTFNQIRRPHNYKYLCCLGIYPTSKGTVEGKCFLFNESEIEDMINEDIFTEQHGKQRWRWTISSKSVPNYYPGEASMEELVHVLSDGEIPLQL